MNVPLEIWCRFWRWRQLYHRYTVEGIEYLDGDRPMLIVGYHARPIAYDMCMLTVAIHDRLGYLPHGVVWRGVESIPGLAWFADSIGFVSADGDGLAEAIGRGEHVVVTPGGADEACRGARDRYRVHWGARTGYLKLALRYDLPIVPVACSGADDTYLAPYDGPALGRRLRLPRDIEWVPWLGLGPLGPWPISPPFPVRLRQLVGEPIHLRAEGLRNEEDRDGLMRAHGRVTSAVQALLDEARGLQNSRGRATARKARRA